MFFGWFLIYHGNATYLCKCDVYLYLGLYLYIYRKGFIVQISWLTTWSYTYNIRGLSLNPKIKLTLEAEQESKRLITHFSSNLKTFLHRKLLKCSLNLPFLWCKGQRAWEISSRCSPHLGVKVKAYAQFLGTTLTLILSY